MSAPIVEQQSTAISKELDYKMLKYSHPTYQHSRVLPLSGGQSVNLTTTNGNQEVLIELPSKPFNFAESFLSWSFTVPAQGGAGRFAWIHADTIPELNQIEVYTRSGQFLCRIEDTNVFLNVVRPVNVELQDFATQGSTDCLEPASLASTNYKPIAVNAGASFVDRQLEKRYLYVSADNTALTLQRRVKLSAFVENILAYDKTIMFPEVLVMRLIFNGSRVGFYGSSATDPTAGNGALTLGGANTIQNLQLYLAVEQNQEVANSLAQKIQSGLDLMIPFVYRIKTNIGDVSQATISVRMNRGHGAVCKRIYHTLGFAVESGNTRQMYDHTNIGADRSTALKVNEYYTMLDNNRLQQYNLTANLNAGLDWIANEKYIQKSAIQNQDQFSYNWVHIEDFSNQSIDNLGSKDNLLSGIDLSVERKFDFYANSLVSGVAYNHYTYVCTLKALKITPTLISVV